jgi:integrase
VREDGGIAYLDINTLNEGKSLKTVGSRRKVPLHSELVRLGFLKYLKGRAREGEGARLFPNLRPDKNGTMTGTWSKWWGRYARQAGITDRRKVFHSFRHTFKDACRAAEIEEPIFDALQGHRGTTVSRMYGEGYPLRVLAAAVEKISYPKVKFPP